MNKKDISVLRDLAKKIGSLSKKMEEAYSKEEFEKFQDYKKEFLNTQKKFSKKIK